MVKKMKNTLSTMYDFSVLRELRKREGLNIADVSDRSGISAAVISKLERNRTTAELETLFRLSRVFGMNATDLMALAERRTAHKTTASDHRSDGFDFTGIRYSNVRCLLGTAARGKKVFRPEIHQDDYEVCWVLKGKLRLTLPHEAHELKVGHAVQFDAILEHTYEALDDCQVLILHLRKGKRF
jgi:transcriptional regulator with XRE-family HTH domain